MDLTLNTVTRPQLDIVGLPSYNDWLKIGSYEVCNRINSTPDSNPLTL